MMSMHSLVLSLSITATRAVYYPKLEHDEISDHAFLSHLHFNIQHMMLYCTKTLVSKPANQQQIIMFTAS